MITKHAYVEGVSFGNLQASAVGDHPEIQARFAYVTAALRKEQSKTGTGKELSEKVDDFLYASCIMMHAAEASLINQETGEPIVSKVGSPVQGWFEQYRTPVGRETVRWISPDGIKPYRNGNLDIFPEAELVKAHKEWVGKPLCKDHVSNTVDGIRGVIVDTYYDPKFKRVHALFALDKKNYPDLARKVEAGYATNVSMGTGVGRSVCVECQNVATIASEFCGHVRNRTHYGEINLDLNPIELSIVVTGADPLAKIRKIVASLNDYRSQVDSLRKIKGAPLEELTAIAEDIDTAMSQAKEPAGQVALQILDKVKDLSRYDRNDRMEGRSKLLASIAEIARERTDVLSTMEKDELGEVIDALRYHAADPTVTNLFQIEFDRHITGVAPTSSQETTGTPDSSMSTLNVGVSQLPNSEDLHLESPTPFSERTPGLQMAASITPLNDTKMLFEIEKAVEGLSNRLASIKNKWVSLNSSLPETTLAGADIGECMSFGEIRKRTAMRRKAYLLGTEEPKEYPQMGDQEKLRLQDRQMVGDELDTKAENPDQKAKEMLLRAELADRRAKRAELLSAIAADGTALKDSGGKTVAVVDKGGKVTKVEGDKLKGSMAADDGKAEDKDDLMEAKAAMARELEILREAAKKKKLSPKEEKALAKEKAKKEAEKAAAKAAKEKAAEKAAKEKSKKKAYLLGTEEPKEYPQMGDQEKLRTQDRQMVGDVLDTKAENPDQKVKEMLHRARLSAVLTKSANVADSRWTVMADGQPVFTLTAGRAYNQFLGEESDVAGKTWGELFQTREYGKKLLAEAKSGNLSKIAEELDKAAPVVAPEMPAEEMPVEEDRAAAPMPMDVPAAEDASALKDRVMSALQKVEECVADLRKAVMGEDEGVENVDVEMAATAALDRGMFEAQAGLTAIASELRYLAEEADLTDADVVLAARAAVRDARLAQIEAIERVAEYEAAKSDCGDMNLEDQDLEEVKEEVEGAIEEHEGSLHEKLDEELEVIEEKVDGLSEKVDDVSDEEADLQSALEALRKDLEALESAEKEDDASDGKAALAARAEVRKNLIQRAAAADAMLSKNTLLEEAHKGENRTVDVDATVSDKLNVVHDNFQTQEVAMKAVKTAAAGLADAVRQGKLRDADLDGLAAVAAVDPAAVKYYREFYGKVDSTFAKEMTEDFKKSASDDNVGVRYSRAYNLALEAQGKGFISAGRQALDQFAESLVGGSDSNFEATKRIVAQLKVPTKTASMPQVGVIEDGETPTVKVASQTVNVRDPLQLGKALFNL